MASSDEVKLIRKSLKKLGLSNRSVSVRQRFFGCSSRIDITIKNDEAKKFESEIKHIAKKAEKYEIDEKTQEMLQGGNTFVFVYTL